MPTKTRPVIDRLLARVVEGPDGCWLFTGALTAAGYGAIGLGSRAQGVDTTHRVTFQYFISEVPPGLDLDHLCRVRSCCNPWHLEPVSRAENVARGLRHAGWSESAITHCMRGHQFTATNTMRSGKQRYCRACMRIRYHNRRAAA